MYFRKFIELTTQVSATDCTVGELVKPTANRAGYLNHGNLKFNESFRVQRMSTATATSLHIAYKIVGEG